MAADMMLKVAMALLAVSIFLQFLAYLTPAWYVFVAKDSGESFMYGVLYDVKCLEDGGCETKVRWDWNDNKFEGRLAYSYVTKNFQVILPLVLCVIACVMKVKAIRQSVWWDSYKVICVFCLLVANTVQWMKVSDFAQMALPYDNIYIDHGFSWSVLLYAFGACLTSATTIINLVALRIAHRRTQRRDYELTEVAK